ncbi:MAG: hypothetical protein JW804_09625 [Sedimentisphaerales bacterium]|nr:hypothetical protein [Sedimentisphaerales bacterium]
MNLKQRIVFWAMLIAAAIPFMFHFRGIFQVTVQDVHFNETFYYALWAALGAIVLSVAAIWFLRDRSQKQQSQTTPEEQV